ncbi:hypothetical protein KVT40_000674 [Elsinoe batatas]|uniref:Uncharacterized protein n=1 Tax=Elsinoe batatas TaxID=2601811 RepID=A0A8K0L864_9PEZI|nr:hypothetical protein KVT40_000674 [Elsinoe batatas]
MVNRWVNARTLYCRPLPTDESRNAYSICLGPTGMYVAYEFTETAVPTALEAFLEEVAAYLAAEGLQELVAIAVSSPQTDPWIEVPSSDGIGTASTPCLGGAAGADPGRGWTEALTEDETITEWIFGLHEGQMSVRPWKKCVQPPSGGHKDEQE